MSAGEAGRSSVALGVLLAGALLIGSAAFAGAPLPAEVVRYPELVLYSGKVVTVDPAFSIQEAVAVRDGRILAVGPTARIRTLAGPETLQIDLRGRTLIPGLYDSHLHMFRAGFYWAKELRLDGVTSLAELLQRVRERASELRPGEWIITLGVWHEDQLRERRMPMRQELDQAAPDHPVYLQALHTHAVANTAALRAAGIAASTAAPRGGQIEKGPDGEPTGVLRGAALPLVTDKWPRPTFEEKIAGLQLVMHDFNRVGITSVLEATGRGVRDEDYHVLYEAWRRGLLTVRVAFPFHAPGGLEHVRQWLRFAPGYFGDEWLRTIGVGEWVSSRLSDDVTPPRKVAPEVREEFRQIALELARNRRSLHLHATNDTTIDAILDVLEEVDRQHPIRDLRYTLTHIELVTDAQIARMKRLGMGAALQSRQVIQGGRMRRAWGERGLEVPPFRKFLAQEVPVGLGTDTTVVAAYSPFFTLWWAVTGKMIGGEQLRRRELLSREEALRLHTVGSAWFSFEEKLKGSLEPGKLADMVVLNEDYLTVPEDRIKELRAVMTIAGGRIVYQEP